METVRDNPANRGEAKARRINRRSENSSKDSSEIYRFTASRKFVSRTVVVNGHLKRSTKLRLCKNGHPVDEPHSAFDWAFLRASTKPVIEKEYPAIRGVDLFCGCGGLSLGTQEACAAIGYRFESLLAIDEDTSALDVYIRNFAPRQAYNRDIREFLQGELGAALQPCEKTLLKGVKNVDIVLAGPPCQGNSSLNNYTRRKDHRNKLYERVGRFAEIAEPKHIIIENVPAVVYGHDRALDNTVTLLDKLGYKLDTGIIDLSEFGVPQRRRRHVLVASVNKHVSIRDTVDKYRVNTARTVRWAIEDLEQKNGNVFNSWTISNPDNMERIVYLQEHGLYNLPDHMRPPCHQDGDHRYTSMYGRIKYDEPAQTITRGFGSPGQGRFVHPVQPRTLTPHEAARLQFFPDFFDFSGVKERTYLARMIGNAVPMKLSYVFCSELLT